MSDDESLSHPHEPEVAPILAPDGACLVCARTHLRGEVAYWRARAKQVESQRRCLADEVHPMQARIRELGGFVRLGLTVDQFNPADIAAWQRMAKVALREEQG